MLEFKLERNYEAYKKNVEMDELRSLIINEKGIMEESLSKQHQFCLELFRAQCPMVDVESVELPPWQQNLLDVIKEEELKDQKIIWIKGAQGNEEKSWFQS